MFLKGSTASILVSGDSAGRRLRCQMNMPIVAVTSSPRTKVSQAGTGLRRRVVGDAEVSAVPAGVAMVGEEVIPPHWATTPAPADPAWRTGLPESWPGR